MSTKKHRLYYPLSFGLVIAALILVTSMFVGMYTNKSTVEVILSSRDWTHAEIIEQIGLWCPPTDPDTIGGNQITIYFVNSEKIVVSTTTNRATITLIPRIPMETKTLQGVFNNSELSEGEILDITLDGGDHIQLFICGRKVFLIAPAFG